MQQSPRFAPFGPWKSSSTSANHFPRFLSGLLAFPERHFSEVHSPYGPWAIPPLSTEGPLGKHATSFSNVTKPNASTDASLHPKWRECWYKPLNKVTPQIGLGGILQNLKGNKPDWSAKPLTTGLIVPLPRTGESPRFPRSDYEEPTPERIEAFKASGSRLARILYSTPDNTNAPPSPLSRPAGDKQSAGQNPIPKADKPNDDELKITIGGPTGYLSWDHVAQTSDLYAFFQRRNQNASNSLSVEWHDCAIDQTGTRGRTTLKLLFRYLNKPLTLPGTNAKSLHPLSTLTKVSVKVPEIVRDLCPIDLFGNVIQEDDAIDLCNASCLRELCWSGDFSVFSLKFSNVPMASLTVLTVTDCLISIDDAIAIAHACPDLKVLTLQTIVPSSSIDYISGEQIKPSVNDLVDFPNLTVLRIKCAERHGLIVDRMGLGALESLHLHLDVDRIHTIADFDNPTILWGNLDGITIVGKVERRVHDYLKSRCKDSAILSVEL